MFIIHVLIASYLYRKMPHQQTNQLEFMTQSASNHQSNLPPTQPTSNISSSNNTTTTLLNSNSSSSNQQVAASPSTPTCQILVSPNIYQYNNLYGCQSILASKKKHVRLKQSIFAYCTACTLVAMDRQGKELMFY